MKLTRRALLASSLASLALPKMAFAQGETIKIGVLHSLSGTMAISETTLKHTMLKLIEAQTARGVCWGNRCRPWSWTRRPTGRCSPKGHANC